MADSLDSLYCCTLRRVILEQGLDEVAKAIGLNTTTLLRAAVGLPLHNATRQLVERWLKEETNGSEKSQA